MNAWIKKTIKNINESIDKAIENFWMIVWPVIWQLLCIMLTVFFFVHGCCKIADCKYLLGLMCFYGFGYFANKVLDLCC